MTEENAGVRVIERSFKTVPVSFPIRGGSLRGAPTMILDRTGHARTNVTGAELLDRVAQKSGLDPVSYVILFALDEANNAIILYPVAHHEPGSMPIRKSKSGSRIAVHLGGLFSIHPHLRPAATMQCHLQEIADANGNPCVQLTVLNALPMQRRRSSGVTQAPAAGQ